MRLLVTGGAGFIGATTAAALLDAGHEVTVVDDLSPGHRDAVPDAGAASTAPTSPTPPRCAASSPTAASTPASTSPRSSRPASRCVTPSGSSRSTPAGARRCWRRCSRRRRTVRAVLDRRGLRRARARPRSTRTIRCSRPTPTASPSCWSSGCWTGTTASTGCAPLRCATSTPPARPRAVGERHEPETHLIPLRAAGRRRPAAAHRDLRRRLPHAGRHLRARLRPRRRPRRRARPRARARSTEHGTLTLQPRQRHAASASARSIEAARAVTGRADPAPRSHRAAPGDPAVAGRQLGARPRHCSAGCRSAPTSTRSSPTPGARDFRRVIGDRRDRRDSRRVRLPHGATACLRLYGDGVQLLPLAGRRAATHCRSLRGTTSTPAGPPSAPTAPRPRWQRSAAGPLPAVPRWPRGAVRLRRRGVREPLARPWSPTRRRRRSSTAPPPRHADAARWCSTPRRTRGRSRRSPAASSRGSSRSGPTAPASCGPTRRCVTSCRSRTAASEVGATLPHPHGQIYALDHAPHRRRGRVERPRGAPRAPRRLPALRRRRPRRGQRTRILAANPSFTVDGPVRARLALRDPRACAPARRPPPGRPRRPPSGTTSPSALRDVVRRYDRLYDDRWRT